MEQYGKYNLEDIISSVTKKNNIYEEHVDKTRIKWKEGGANILKI